MQCEKIFVGMCLVTPSTNSASLIFKFTDFITALALLFVLYTIVDIRFRFRVAIAPQELLRHTYILMGLIGVAILITDIWVAEGFLVPMLLSQSVWRGFLGAYFLLLPMMWVYYGYIRPPIFGSKNCKKFAGELYGNILRGSNSKLPIIASELARSAPALVTLCRPFRQPRPTEAEEGKVEDHSEPNVGDYAHDLILLIATRRLCKHIVAASPITAMVFFEEMTLQKKYEIPIGAFAANISVEAILNKDSILYHEGDGSTFGLMGYIKDFSQAIYGNFKLVESLAANGRSPLDIPYKVVQSWDASQYEVYARAVLITLEDYIDSKSWGRHSYALRRALEEIESSCRDISYKLNDIEQEYYSSDVFQRLKTAVDFVKDAVALISRQDPLPHTGLRLRERHKHNADFV